MPATSWVSLRPWEWRLSPHLMPAAAAGGGGVLHTGSQTQKARWLSHHQVPPPFLSEAQSCHWEILLGSLRPLSPPPSRRALPKYSTAKASGLTSLFVERPRASFVVLSAFSLKAHFHLSRGHTLCKHTLSSDTPSLPGAQSIWSSHILTTWVFHAHPQITPRVRFLSSTAIVIPLTPPYLGSGPKVQTLDALEISPMEHPWPWETLYITYPERKLTVLLRDRRADRGITHPLVPSSDLYQLHRWPDLLTAPQTSLSANPF